MRTLLVLVHALLSVGDMNDDATSSTCTRHSQLTPYMYMMAYNNYMYMYMYI